MEETVLLGHGSEVGVRICLEGVDAQSDNGLHAVDVIKKATAMKPAGFLNPVFYRNLLHIDSNLPLIYTNLVFLYYVNHEKENSLRALVQQLTRQNSIGFSEQWIYEEKIRRWLVATALGVGPEQEWDGTNHEIVRNIVIESGGKKTSFSGTQTVEFGQYLLDVCTVRAPLKTKNLGYLYEHAGRQYINLALDVVF